MIARSSERSIWVGDFAHPHKAGRISSLADRRLHLVDGKRQFHVHAGRSKTFLFGPSAAREGALRHGRPDRLGRFCQSFFDTFSVGFRDDPDFVAFDNFSVATVTPFREPSPSSFSDLAP